MSRPDPHLTAFNERVALKYQLYNGLFLGLPFEDLEDIGTQLPLFAAACRDQLQAGRPPTEIVERFFKDREARTARLSGGRGRGKRAKPARLSHDEKVGILFKVLQLVERQVVLFDALEDAAFPYINDLEGRGSLSHLLARVSAEGKRERLADILSDYKVRIVLTAHPTQFYPDSILGIITDLSGAIAADKLPAIHELLLQMGKTRFQNRQRPTPLEEARSLIWYLEHIFYDALPSIQDRLVSALPGEPRDPSLLSPKVELGFWPGGDRDGNPYVTSETTVRVAQELKGSLLALYLKDLDALLGRLTFDGVIQPLQSARDRLAATAAVNAAAGAMAGLGGARPYAGPGELLADLRDLRRELLDNHAGLFLGRLDGVLHKVQLFGFHFASLDLRQDSRVLSQALAESLGALAAQAPGDDASKAPRGRTSRSSAPEPSEAASEKPLPAEAADYATLEPARRLVLLEALLAAPQFKGGVPGVGGSGAEGMDPLTSDTLATLAAAKSIQKANGAAGLHRFVISNTQSASNVLEVMALARLAGWKAHGLDLDVVPLFETIDDLEHAEGIMRRLYASPAYGDHLKRRGKVQYIMLGFSDGTKDGGYMTANWAIHKAKRNLTRAAREAGIRAVFFDGRGGPPARGGGNTHKFYRSLGADIEHSEIQLTVQGQTISSNFGTPEAARFNAEQLFTAGLEDKLFPPDAPDLAPEGIRLLDRLSEASRDAYRRFKADPLFLPYLEEMTPLSYYGMLNIASRPTRRKGGSSLRFEDLRAIPFVGAWSQMKQNIPGFYGVGTALSKLLSPGRRDNAAQRRRLGDLYRSSLFFRTLLENAMMSLSKSYFPLTAYLEKDRKYGRFWKRIYREATTAKTLLKEITGQQKLLENNPAVRESIHIRERLILPLLVIQQHSMGMVKAIQRSPASYPEGALDVYAKLVVKAMAANINAARNSA